MAIENFNALLIGVDYYMTNNLNYGSLNGCVQDVALVEEFLRNQLAVPQERILKLLSPHPNTFELSEVAKLPTYENIVAAFQEICNVAQRGEQVYIHYSGHGGRTKTNFPEQKGLSGLDESLVPMDIAKPQARYLRDIELAYLLQQMVDKGLIVTVVLDCCHSGGVTRGGVAVRGSKTIDQRPQSTESLVATNEKLIANWKRLVGESAKHTNKDSVWFEPKGYALLAACRESELAYECPFYGQSNGALTYWLINSLQQMGSNITFTMLYNRIIGKIHTELKYQTPQLMGDCDRIVFGRERISHPDAVNVMKVANEQVLLNTGQAQAVRKGTQFAIYPSGVTDFAQLDKRLALVEIIEVGATSSWAKITKVLNSTKPIDSGNQAVLTNPVSMSLRSKVALLQNNLPSSINQNNALEKLRQAVIEDSSGFLVLTEAEQGAKYNVIINTNGEYEICDASQQTIQNLCPTLHIDAEDSATRVVKRLVHLTKFSNIQRLDCHDFGDSPVAGKLLVELYKAPADYEPNDQPQPQQRYNPGDIPTVSHGEWTFLRVQNKSNLVINVNVLALLSDWSIVQIFPKKQDMLSIPFDPGQERFFPLRGKLLPGYTHSDDVLKVMATVGTTNFRWLELAALDETLSENRNMTRQASNLTEEFLAAFVADKARHFDSVDTPHLEWATAQLEVRVQ